MYHNISDEKDEWMSYADCDDHFVRSFLPPGLKPFWTVDDISEATDDFYFEDSDSDSEILGYHEYLKDINN